MRVWDRPLTEAEIQAGLFDTIPAGTETDAITSMMDILPTFTKLAGGTVPTDRKIDGGDIRGSTHPLVRRLTEGG